jgi:hypothetical protein
MEFAFKISIVVLLSSCAGKKEMRVDNRSFMLVNLNQEFPILNFSNYSEDSLGLTCSDCMHNNKKLFLVSAFINGPTKSVSIPPAGMGAAFSFSYDSVGRIERQVVESCYRWDISFDYSDTLGCVYQFAQISGESLRDTTVYKLDTYGRVVGVIGFEYGDLMKRSISKRVYYKDTSSIPDSILTTFEANRKKGIRKEIFYQHNTIIDSIRIENVSFEFPNREEYTNYFNEKESFVGRKYWSGEIDGKNIYHVEECISKPLIDFSKIPGMRPIMQGGRIVGWAIYCK